MRCTKADGVHAAQVNSDSVVDIGRVSNRCVTPPRIAALARIPAMVLTMRETSDALSDRLCIEEPDELDGKSRS